MPAFGISEDVALLLAYEKGAELIVAVGTHFNLIEFLERNRSGMSSTFMARLRVGEILVDAKGVSRLVSRRVGVWPLVAFAGAGLGAIVVAIAASPELRSFIELLASGSSTRSASADRSRSARGAVRPGPRRLGAPGLLPAASILREISPMGYWIVPRAIQRCPR